MNLKNDEINVLKQTLSKRNDEELVKAFRAYPLKRLIFNAITFALFIAFFAALSAGGGDADNYTPYIFLALGCMSVVVFNKINPSYYRGAVALVMMERYKTKKDSENNKFFYYYRKEYELFGERKTTAADVVIHIVGSILKIINFFFDLLAAVLALAISLAVMVILGGGLWAFHLVAGGNETLLRLSKACAIPAKWAFSFLKRVLSLKDFVSDGSDKVSYSATDLAGDAFTNDPNKMGNALSDTKLRGYISLSGCVLPGSCHWEGTPSVSVMHNGVYINGEIACDKDVYKDKNDVDSLLGKCKDIVKSEVSAQINKFHRDYPNSSDVTLDIKLEGKRV